MIYRVFTYHIETFLTGTYYPCCTTKSKLEKNQKLKINELIRLKKYLTKTPLHSGDILCAIQISSRLCEIMPRIILVKASTTWNDDIV